MSITTNFKISDGTDLGNIFIQQASSANKSTAAALAQSPGKLLYEWTGGTVTFNSPGNYLLSFTVINSYNNDANQNFYSIALMTTPPYTNPYGVVFSTLPIGQGWGGSFSPKVGSTTPPVPWNVTGLFNTATGGTYGISVYNYTSDSNWALTIYPINTLYLGNPN